MEGKNIPIIYPIKDPDPIPSSHKPIHPNLPQIDGFGGGAMILMISAVATGKSTIISNILLGEDFYNAQERFEDTYIISNTIANCITSRYVRQAFTTYDEYHDSIIDGIIAKQKRCECKADMDDIAIIVDDCLGSIPLNSSVNTLAAKFRHFNVRLLLFSSQRFHGAVSPVIRANATNVIIGSPFPNVKELGHIAESYGDNFGGEKKFLEIYRLCTPNKYDFMHINFQSQPPTASHNFEYIVAEGDKIIVNTKIQESESESEEEEESGGANFVYKED